MSEWGILKAPDDYVKYRKPMKIEYKQQRYRSKQCGQTCLAMVTGKDVKEVCKDMNKYRSTQLYGDLDKYLKREGYEVTRHSGVVNPDEVPNNSIIRFVFPNGGGHFVVKSEDKYYDPAIGVVLEFNDYRKITHYINYKK